MMPLTANLGAACADKHALRADAHLALVAAGQEEHSDAQDVIWRQSEGVWGVSLRMHGRLLSVLTCGVNSQHENLHNLLSQPYCASRYRAWRALSPACTPAPALRSKLIWRQSIKEGGLEAVQGRQRSLWQQAGSESF